MKIILWLGLPAFIGALILYLVLMPHEPVYHGYSLTQWLDDYYVDSRSDINDDSPHTEAYFAIRAIGTNALPTLLDWVTHDPPAPNPRLAQFADHLPSAIADNRFVWKITHPEWRPNNWPQAFSVLGAQANGAVPELTRLMYAPDAPYDGLIAAGALASIGPAGLPSLEAAVLDPHARCRSAAIEMLDTIGCVGANSVAVLPVLNRMLTNSDVVVRTAAIKAFRERAEIEEQHGPLTTIHQAE